jgi:predicted SprT family Zn-dependent metalloprotease
MDLRELEAAAAREMARHGLVGWTFGLAATRHRLGVCKYRTKRIEISEYYARNSPPSTVLDTLLHEIAHAIAGPAARHGPVWKAVAVRLGATPRACEKSGEAVVQPGDWQATCSHCTQTFHRYRRPKRLTGYRCRCVARSPLVFAFVGDPKFRPVMSKSLEESARWEAKCSGCGTVHLRLRQPKAGVWRCRCPQRCEITWQARSQQVPGR